ncbi:MAG: protein translocase subunit SecD [Anaerolineales bacterium]|nr:protein translocase subunit SecD [Anaerolineales bacterium]MBP6209102.1 protein translocase subunit SecD [Anaerolineales bacterium]MBP8165099.1 protein translocase subunit SecD [Anaerolineales bacterium]
MRNKNSWLVLIVLLLAFSLWVDLSDSLSVINPFNDTAIVDRNVETKLGLDLRGGLQALLEADVPADSEVPAEDLINAKNILQNRANALGVSEVVMQTAGDRRIVAEFPGVTNPEEVVAALKQTALLEFVDMGTAPVPEGTLIQTDFGLENAPATTDTGEPIYHTVMTGAGLQTASVSRGQTGEYAISFTLKDDATNIFGEYTTSHQQQYLAIVLDKRVISTPIIQSPITDGQGQISGNFTQDTAQTLAVQLRSGALPIPIKVVESRTVGPTLGEESLRKSVMAGVIGMIVVILFMGIYYRLPGLVADLALICYAIFTLMLFKLIPVVLTLPGIAGFILSVGMAVDANVLIFERLKEELRHGRNLRQAIDLAWSRAWPSIRDSNTSTLITCVILFVFGNTFGASIVKGFSVTLALGVGVSLFTAIIVTRTFLHALLDGIKSIDHPRWFGL